jgi:PAS domain S-box-containing protein
MFEFRKSILLVEDEAIIGMTTARALEQEYEVTTVLRGEEAIEVIRGGKRIDLILMDIDLGRGMDGTEAAEIILRDRHLPVVFLSSHTEKAVIDKTEKITSYGYVLKDTRYTVLFASIKMAFKLYEARRAISEKENKYHVLNERYRLAISSAKIGIWDLDVLQNTLFWDEQTCEIYGIQAKVFSGDFEAWRSHLHPEDAERAHSEVQLALHGEKAFNTKYRIVRPDGGIRHIKAFARVTRDEAGRSVRMTGINYDITDCL